jgi:hypothetical protein
MVDSVRFISSGAKFFTTLKAIVSSKYRNRTNFDFGERTIMKALFLSLFLLLAFGSFQSAEAQVNRQVKVRINQQKIVTGRLAIKVVSVEDSRCPIGTQCIWAGNAKVRIRVTNARGAAQTFDLNTNLQPKTVIFSGYEIRLTNVNPRPANNVRINRNAYTATFSVTRL